MYIKEDLSFEDLKSKCWQGAVDTLETIEEAGKEEELMKYLENFYINSGEIPDLTEVNDFLWFNNKMVLSDLSIEEDEEEI